MSEYPNIDDFKQSPSRLFRCSVKLLIEDGIEPDYIPSSSEWGLTVDAEGKLLDMSPLEIEKLPKILISRTPKVTKHGVHIMQQIDSGVYGSPEDNIPTYFSPEGIEIETTQTLTESYLEVVIDTDELLRHRRVYADPETFEKRDMLNDEQSNRELPGTSFLCFGGVPYKAIKEIREVIVGPE